MCMSVTFSEEMDPNRLPKKPFGLKAKATVNRIVSFYYDRTSSHGRMPINFIPWFQRSILIVFRKRQEVLRRI